MTELDVAWAPLIPPGHTAFSWELEPECDGETLAPKAELKRSVQKIEASAEESNLAAGSVEDAAAAFPSLVTTWMGQSGGDSGLKSKLLVLQNESIRWNPEEKRHVADIPAPEMEVFAKDVERCLKFRFAGLSQGVHDKYVTYCVNRKNKHGQMASGPSLYVHALCLLNGLSGFQMDKDSALLFLHQAAEQGVPEAISLLGYCYELGDGVGECLERAFICYKASVAMGDPHGMVRLGRVLWELKDETEKAKSPALIEEGMNLLRSRVDAGQGSMAEVSRALCILHTQMNLV